MSWNPDDCSFCVWLILGWRLSIGYLVHTISLRILYMTTWASLFECACCKASGMAQVSVVKMDDDFTVLFNSEQLLGETSSRLKALKRDQVHDYFLQSY